MTRFLKPTLFAAMVFAAPCVQAVTLSGTVTKAGAPVAGAKVSVAGAKPWDWTQTDAQGRFVIEIPGEKATLFAASGRAFARLDGAGADSTLALQDAKPVDEAVAREWFLLAARRCQGWTWREFNFNLARSKPELALEAARMGDAGRIVNVINAAELGWALEHLDLITDERQRFYAGSHLARKAVEGNREWALRWFETESAKVAATDFSDFAAHRLLSLAGLGKRLGRAEADALLERARVAVDHSLPGESRVEIVSSYAASDISQGGEAWLGAFLEEESVPTRIRSWSDAMRVLVEIDLPGAKRAFEELERLVATPEAKAWNEKQRKQGEWALDSAFYRGVAAGHLAVALAPTDREAALQLVEKASADWLKAPLLGLMAERLGREKDLAGMKTLMERAWQTTGDGWAIIGDGMAQAVRPFDAAYADELQARLVERFKNLSAQDLQKSWDARPAVVYLALHLAPQDPATARLLLENDWENALAAKNANTHKKALLAQVMGTLDAGRAHEMIAQLPKPHDEFALAFVAAWMNLAPEQRRAMKFNDLGQYLN